MTERPFSRALDDYLGRPQDVPNGGSASRGYVTCCEGSRILQPVAQELCHGHLLPESAMVRAPRCPKGVRLPRPRSPGEPGRGGQRYGAGRLRRAGVRAGGGSTAASAGIGGRGRRRAGPWSSKVPARPASQRCPLARAGLRRDAFITARPSEKAVSIMPDAQARQRLFGWP